MRMRDIARVSLAIGLSAVGPASAQDARPPRGRLEAPIRIGRDVAVAGGGRGDTSPGAGSSKAPAHRRGKHHAGRIDRPPEAPVSQDSAELATLAPPSRASTAEQSYGDAVYARRRLERPIEREEREAAGVTAGAVTRSVCDPREVTSSAYVCGGGGRPGYQTGYGRTPSYLSAPQSLAVPDDEQSRLLSPLTGLAWVVNSLRYDPHNQADQAAPTPPAVR